VLKNVCKTKTTTNVKLIAQNSIGTNC